MICTLFVCFFQNGGDVCSHCLCVAFSQFQVQGLIPAINYGADYHSEAWFQHINCCNQCVFPKCPCGHIHIPTNQYDGFNEADFATGNKVIVACAPCACKCPDSVPVYESDINQFKCGRCNCESKGQCEFNHGCDRCPSSSCFPATASVLLESGKSVESQSFK